MKTAGNNSRPCAECGYGKFGQVWVIGDIVLCHECISEAKDKTAPIIRDRSGNSMRGKGCVEDSLETSMEFS